MTRIVTAAERGFVRCLACGLVSRLEQGCAEPRCRRCRATLRVRKRDSLQRSWAFLIAAALLYLPANLLPIMQTTTFFTPVDDTILSGVVRLWDAGSYDLAIIVFVASIVVPLLKIGVLALLMITVRRRSDWALEQRAKLYRFVEFIGHWSMLDVFVVALLVALVHFKSYALVLPGGGAVAFASVVVLTMMASMSFDPRLIWDAADESRPEESFAS